MVVPLPYLLYDNLAIKMYARERRERSRIHHHRAARHKAERTMRQVVRFVPRPCNYSPRDHHQQISASDMMERCVWIYIYTVGAAPDSSALAHHGPLWSPKHYLSPLRALCNYVLRARMMNNFHFVPGKEFYPADLRGTDDLRLYKGCAVPSSLLT